MITLTLTPLTGQSLRRSRSTASDISNLYSRLKTTVDQLLSLSRLPVHFWTELNGGKPRFGNPGYSLMSYAITRLSNEMIDVPAELQESMQQCTDFTRNPSSINHIFTWISAMTTQAVSAASALPDKLKPQVFGQVNALRNEHNGLVDLYATLAGSDGKLPVQFDNTTALGKLFMQSLIDTKRLMNELLEAVSECKNPTSEPA